MAERTTISNDELKGLQAKYEAKKDGFIAFFFDPYNWFYTLKIGRLHINYWGTRDKDKMPSYGVCCGTRIKFAYRSSALLISIVWHEFGIWFKPYRRHRIHDATA